MAAVFIRGGKFRHRPRGRTPGNNGGRASRDVSTSRETPRIARNHQKLEEAKEDWPQSLQSQHGLVHTLILDFGLQTVREQISAVLSHTVYGNLLWQHRK